MNSIGHNNNTTDVSALGTSSTNATFEDATMGSTANDSDNADAPVTATTTTTTIVATNAALTVGDSSIKRKSRFSAPPPPISSSAAAVGMIGVDSNEYEHHQLMMPSLITAANTTTSSMNANSIPLKGFVRASATLSSITSLPAPLLSQSSSLSSLPYSSNNASHQPTPSQQSVVNTNHSPDEPIPIKRRRWDN